MCEASATFCEPAAQASTKCLLKLLGRIKSKELQQRKKQIFPGTGANRSLSSKCQLLEVSRAWLKIDLQVPLFPCREGSSYHIRFPSTSYHPRAEFSTICNYKFWLSHCHGAQISTEPFIKSQMTQFAVFHRTCTR